MTGINRTVIEVPLPPRGDRAVPCEGGASSSASLVAKVSTPMVRPQVGAGLSNKRKAHPESYDVRHPNYFAYTPAKLRERWAKEPPDPQVILFYDNSPTMLSGMRPMFQYWPLSNRQHRPFSFTLPEWAGRSWLVEQGLEPTATVATVVQALLLIRCSLERRSGLYREALQADSPERVEEILVDAKEHLDEARWHERVCAATVAVIRAKASDNRTIGHGLAYAWCGRLIALAAPEDALNGIGLAATEPSAYNPQEWQGANVLGWAYMVVARERAAAERRKQSKRRKVAFSEETSDFWFEEGSGAALADAVPEDIVKVENEIQPGTASHGQGSAAQAVEEVETLQSDSVQVPLDQCVSIAACVATAQVAYAYCVIITTLLEPFVLAHVDGDTQLAVPLTPVDGPERGRDDRMLDQAERVCRAVAPAGAKVLVPAGLTLPERAPVVAAPIAVRPPKAAIVRTPQERRKRLAAGASFLFLTIAALVDTPAYRVAAPALARVNSFVRPFTDINEAVLAGGVLADQITFRFGGRVVSSLMKGVDGYRRGGGTKVAHCDRVHATERELVDALRAVEGDSDVARYQRESAEAVRFLDLDGVADELCRPPEEAPLPEVDLLPFRHDCPVPVTDYVPRKAPQPESCHTCAQTVATCADFVLPGAACQGQLDEWWANATADLERLSQGLRLEGARRTRTISLASNCFIPCARDCWFDCRREQEEGVRVLDYWQPIESQLNRDVIRPEMEGYPDQALASYIEYGSTYPDLPHSLTLGPQLLSLAEGFDRAQKELAELVGNGWYGLFRHFPFFPFHMCPKGCTERKLEKDRPRPTTDASHPPCNSDGTARVFDTAKQPVYSPNWYARRVGLAPLDKPTCQDCNADSITPCLGCADWGADTPAGPEPITGEGDESSAPRWWAPMDTRKQERLRAPPPQGWQARTSVRWDESFWKGYATWGWYGGRTPEFKPNLRTLMHDQAVLRSPAACLRQPILQACDDWKNAFNHIRVRPQDWPKSVTMAYSLPHLREGEPPHVLFTAEYVLGFGHTDNSGVFQRYAGFVGHSVMRKMDELERPRIEQLRREHPCFDEWATKREALSLQTGRNELRLYTMHTYSDDPTATCVGIPCVLNWLEAWYTVNRRFNMIPALLAKRSLGTQVKWLGALPNPHLGYLTVPNDKLLRVQEMITEALSGMMPKSRYRSLMGFLEWFAWCFVRPRERMWGLYEPLKGFDDGTAVAVVPTDRMRAQLTRWQQELWTVGGVAVEVALPRRKRNLPKHAATFFVSSDAAKEGTDTPGIAGWCHGWTWAWFYPKSWLQLPIAVLEFLSFAVSVIQFEPMLREAPRVVFETDSISTAFNLEGDNAKAPLMQLAFSLLKQTAAWITLVEESENRERASRHIKGKLNLFADAESRGYHHLVSDLCKQLGIHRRQLPLSDAAQRYLHQFSVEATPLVPLPLLGLDVSPACDAHDGPTLLGFLQPPSQEDTSPQRASSAHRTLQILPPPAEVAGPSAQPDVPRIVLRHLEPALEQMLREGVPPSHPHFVALQALVMQVRTQRQEAASAPPPLPGQGPRHHLPGYHRGAESALREASDDYALSGNQVAAQLPAVHPQQPGAIGYPPNSRYALNPPPEVWDEFVQRRQQAIESSFPDGTRSSNDTHWKFWKIHCALWGCSTPIRDNFDAMSGRDPMGQRDELNLAASFIDSRYYTMQPRQKGTVPKPESAFQSYLAVVRVMDCRSIPALPKAELRRMVKGMTNDLIKELGVEVVLPRRKQPIGNQVHESMLRLNEGTKLGPYKYYKDSHFGKSWRRLLGVLDRTGFRKAEWSARSRGQSTNLTFRQVAYCFNGGHLPVRRPSVEQLRAGLHQEVWLYIYPPPSKCDPDGSQFGTKAIPFKRSAHDDTVSLFLQEEIQMHEQGVTDEQRAKMPVFSSEPGVPFHRAAIDTALADALRLCTTPEVAQHLSWHSYRIRLACKLKADNCDNPTIQAAVRWRTDEAIAVYARWEREYHHELLERASKHDATSVQFTALPEVDEQQRIVARLGLQNKTPQEIEREVYKLAQETPPTAGPSPAARTATAVAASAQPTAANVPPQPPRPVTTGGLPAGWRREDRPTARGKNQGRRIITIYYGPNGAKARSLREVLRFPEANQPGIPGSPPDALGGLPPGAGPSSPPLAARPREEQSATGGDAGASTHRSVQAAVRSSRAPKSSGRAAGRQPSANSSVPAVHSLRVRTTDSRADGRQPSTSSSVQAAVRPSRARKSSGRADGRSPSDPTDRYVVQPGMCGTKGCRLPDNHIGLCTTEVLPNRRERK